MKYICCGSKRYKNIDLSKIVDYFEYIARHNMLINNTIYGKKPSNFQILNCHMYDSVIQKKTSKEDFISLYFESCGTPIKIIEDFYEYMNNDNITEYLFYQNNNTNKLKDILKKHNFNEEIKLQLRCGFGHIAELISKNIKPFIIGYSLDENENKCHLYNNKPVNLTCHSPDLEIKIIKYLHDKELIDATFCCINDNKYISLSDRVQPTIESLNLLREIYNEDIRYD